jgi:hypothetical protein
MLPPIALDEPAAACDVGGRPRPHTRLTGCLGLHGTTGIECGGECPSPAFALPLCAKNTDMQRVNRCLPDLDQSDAIKTVFGRYGRTNLMLIRRRENV